MILSTRRSAGGQNWPPVYTSDCGFSATAVPRAKPSDRSLRQNLRFNLRKRGQRNRYDTVAYPSLYTVYTYIYELIERAGMRVAQAKITRSVPEPWTGVDTRLPRPIQPQYACLCGTRSDAPGVCCGGAMYLVGGKAR